MKSLKYIIPFFLITFLGNQVFATDPLPLPKDLPKDVLNGTDIESFGKHIKSIEVFEVPIKFSFETGGATATLSLRKKGKMFVATRIYQEPTANKKTKVYSDLALKNKGTWMTGPTIELVKVSGGVLVLEYKSGIEGIPKNLWFFYRNPYSTF